MSLFTEFKQTLVDFITNTYEASFTKNNKAMSARRSEDVCKLLKVIDEAEHPITLKQDILDHMGTLYEQSAFMVRVAFKLGIDSSKLHKGLKQIVEDKRFDDKRLQTAFDMETRAMVVQAIEKSEQYQQLQAAHAQLSKTINDFIDKLQKAEARIKELEAENQAQAERIKELEKDNTKSYAPHVTVEVNTRAEDEHKIQDLELEMKVMKTKNCALTQENQQLTQKNTELVLEKNKLESEILKKDNQINLLSNSNQQLMQKNLTYLKEKHDEKLQVNTRQADVKKPYPMSILEEKKPSFWHRLFHPSKKPEVQPSNNNVTSANICYINS